MKIPRDFAGVIGTAMKNTPGFTNVIGNIEIISIHHLNISSIFQLKTIVISF